MGSGDLTEQINRVILEEQLSWSWFGALSCPFWVSRCMERTVSAATPGPKDIPSFFFLTLTSDYPHFLWQLLRDCSVEMY